MREFYTGTLNGFVKCSYEISKVPRLAHVRISPHHSFRCQTAFYILEDLPICDIYSQEGVIRFTK